MMNKKDLIKKIIVNREAKMKYATVLDFEVLSLIHI